MRRIESMSDAARLRARSDLLDEARGIVDARVIVAFERPPGGELVLLAATAAPSHAALDAIATSVARGQGELRDVVRIAADAAVAVSAHRRKQSASGVGAVFARPVVSSWEADLLDYLRLRLVSHERHESAAPPSRPGLVLPKGMIPGTSPAMSALLASVAATVRSNLDVLLLGETGTGKEVFARLIHASGPTAGGPFVAINCAAIPSELLEAELFGVQARVATGVDPRTGLFMQANGGAIFLDEIGELSEGLQAKLLRVLQEREVLPIGGNAPRKIDVRVIAASNRDLRTLRPDLYYRLRGLQFHLPPLRERKEDIAPLVLSFVERAAGEYRKRIRGVSRAAMELLLAHDWPGNVRELQSEVARAVLLAFDGGVLQTEHFSAVHPAPIPPAPSLPPSAPPSAVLSERVDAVEREAILDALRRSHGNKSRAAKLLGITRNGLAMKMERLGIG